MEDTAKSDTQSRHHVKTGRDWILESEEAQECLGLPELEKTSKDPPLEALERAWPCQHPDFRVLVSTIVRTNSCCF